MFGLGTAKGLHNKDEPAAGQSLLKKDKDKPTDFSKLQEMPGPADAKVQ